jgi:hypothetical protein
VNVASRIKRGNNNIIKEMTMFNSGFFFMKDIKLMRSGIKIIAYTQIGEKYGMNQIKANKRTISTASVAKVILRDLKNNLRYFLLIVFIVSIKRC